MSRYSDGFEQNGEGCSVSELDYSDLFYYPEPVEDKTGEPKPAPANATIHDRNSCAPVQETGIDGNCLGLKVMARVQDVNSSGIVFGGWIFSQMDTGVATVAQEQTGGPVATVGVDDFMFLDRMYPGEVISVYCKQKGVGNSSIRFNAEAWAEDCKKQEPVRKVASGVFTFVAVDEEGRPRMIPSLHFTQQIKNEPGTVISGNSTL